MSEQDRNAQGRVNLGDLLGGSPDDGVIRDRVLVDVAFHRCLRSAGPMDVKELSPLDADALDALSLAEGESARVPAKLRDRAETLSRLGSLLTSGETLGVSLADRVMQAAAAEPRKIHKSEERRSLKFILSSGWRDVVSLAAVLVLGMSLLWPLLGAAGHYAKRMQCSNNMSIAAAGLGMYANDFGGSLPSLTAGLQTNAWWDIRPDAAVSNAANLYSLPRMAYTTLASLACPGNPAAPRGECPKGHWDWKSLGEISYSYQVMRGSRVHVRIDGPVRVVIADASPVVRQAIAGRPANPEENSANHERAGQQVLFSDGSTRWAYSPVVDGDNIWLPMRPGGQVQLNIAPLNGHECPESYTDAFVGP